MSALTSSEKYMSLSDRFVCWLIIYLSLFVKVDFTPNCLMKLNVRKVRYAPLNFCGKMQVENRHSV